LLAVAVVVDHHLAAVLLLVVVLVGCLQDFLVLHLVHQLQ
jgi:hypothetical protein